MSSVVSFSVAFCSNVALACARQSPCSALLCTSTALDWAKEVTATPSSDSLVVDSSWTAADPNSATATAGTTTATASTTSKPATVRWWVLITYDVVDYIHT
jgi:hypothetical protein